MTAISKGALFDPPGLGVRGDVGEAPVLCPFMEYSMTFTSLPETASDVICGAFIPQIVLDNGVKFGYPGTDAPFRR